jgi:3-hydroxyacyl-[acyl-carrier-protein] dehydratase
MTFELEGVDALDDDSVFYLVGIDGARFKRPVVPGDQLMLHGALDRARGGMYRYHCRAEVDGEAVAEAQIMCAVRGVA